MVKKHLKQFVNFVRTKGVVGLAVGLAIGTQVTNAVGAVVHGLIDPAVGMLVGNQQGLNDASFTLDIAGRVGVFKWGSVVSALIVLLAVSALIYYVVTGLRLDRIDKKDEPAV